MKKRPASDGGSFSAAIKFNANALSIPIERNAKTFTICINELEVVMNLYKLFVAYCRTLCVKTCPVFYCDLRLTGLSCQD